MSSDEDYSKLAAPFPLEVICQLTILGVSKGDVGELSEEGDNAHTSAVARAFKRACSDFGLGRYIYGLPIVSCCDQGSAGFAPVCSRLDSEGIASVSCSKGSRLPMAI